MKAGSRTFLRHNRKRNSKRKPPSSSPQQNTISSGLCSISSPNTSTQRTVSFSTTTTRKSTSAPISTTSRSSVASRRSLSTLPVTATCAGFTSLTLVNNSSHIKPPSLPSIQQGTAMATQMIKDMTKLVAITRSSDGIRSDIAEMMMKRADSAIIASTTLLQEATCALQKIKSDSKMKRTLITLKTDDSSDILTTTSSAYSGDSSTKSKRGRSSSSSTFNDSGYANGTHTNTSEDEYIELTRKADDSMTGGSGGGGGSGSLGGFGGLGIIGLLFMFLDALGLLNFLLSIFQCEDGDDR